MAKYIEKEVAVKIAEKYGLTDGSVLGRHSGIADCIASEIATLPIADVAPVRHGWWVDRIVDENEVIQPWMERYYCSECLEGGNQSWFKFCPNCGAKMDGGADND